GPPRSVCRNRERDVPAAVNASRYDDRSETYRKTDRGVLRKLVERARADQPPDSNSVAVEQTSRWRDRERGTLGVRCPLVTQVEKPPGHAAVGRCEEARVRPDRAVSRRDCVDPPAIRADDEGVVNAGWQMHRLPCPAPVAAHTQRAFRFVANGHRVEQEV